MKGTADVFILTRQSFDGSGGHQLRYYGRSSDGKVVRMDVSNSPPVFYIKKSCELPDVTDLCRRDGTLLKNPDGEPVDKLRFTRSENRRSLAGILRESGISVYEDDIRTEDLFLMERFINGTARVEGQCYQNDRGLIFKNPRMSPVDFDPDLTVASVDIETNSRTGQIYSIGCHVWNSKSQNSIVFMIGPPKESSERLFFVEDEKSLLLVFFEWFNQMDPDVIIGWFVVGFDLRVIAERCERFKVPFNMSRGYGRSRLYERRRRKGLGAMIAGRVVLDGQQLLRSSFIKLDDYSLESAARRLLGKGKVALTGGSKGDVITRKFLHDKKGLAAYNLQDCLLVSEIFRKTGILQLAITRSKLNGMPLDRVSGTTSSFDHFYTPRFHKAGFVACSVQDVKKPRRNVGGHVMEPKTGLYDNVVVLDFKSLYPSVIQTFKIDPVSVLSPGKNPLVTPCGIPVSRDDHPLPELIGGLMKKRAEAKAAKRTLLQKAIKIHMNGFYGVMGSNGCRFFDERLPRAIVGNSNWVLLQSRQRLESLGYKVLYGDTDSLFVQLGENQEAEKGFQIAKELNRYWAKRLRREYGIESFLEIEFEKFFVKFLLPLSRGGRSAKKKYAGLVVTRTGTKVHFVGMESVRSDWTPLAKKFQLGLYGRVFRGKPYKEWLQQFVLDVTEGKKDKELIYTKRLKKDLHRYKVNPPQVKAAKMLPKPPRIVQYLITTSGPVPIQLDPKEIDYKHYIDKQLKPLADAILGVIGTSFNEIIWGEQTTLF